MNNNLKQSLEFQVEDFSDNPKNYVDVMLNRIKQNPNQSATKNETCVYDIKKLTKKNDIFNGRNTNNLPTLEKVDHDAANKKLNDLVIKQNMDVDKV